MVFVQEIIQFPVPWHETGPQNAKFKGSKYVSTKTQQNKKARENLGVYSILIECLLHEFSPTCQCVVFFVFYCISIYLCLSSVYSMGNFAWNKLNWIELY